MAYVDEGLGRRFGFNPFRKGKKGKRGRLYTAGALALGAGAYYGGKAAGMWGQGNTPPGKTIKIPKPSVAGPPVVGPPLPPAQSWGPKVGGVMQNVMSALPTLTQKFKPSYEPAIPPPSRPFTFLGMGSTALTVAGVSVAVLTVALIIKKKGTQSSKIF